MRNSGKFVRKVESLCEKCKVCSKKWKVYAKGAKFVRKVESLCKLNKQNKNCTKKQSLKT